jgi:ParB-like chromosome segregation protein Spo0J
MTSQLNAVLNPHPLCLVIPAMTDSEFEALQDNIKKEGLLEEIITYQDQILDGRHRYKACLNLGIDPVTREFEPEIDGSSPTQFVLAKNLHRRHLSTSQRAAVAADIRQFMREESGLPADDDNDAEPSRASFDTITAAAETMNVSVASVKRGAKLKKNDPEEFEKVKKGEVTLSAAQKKSDAKPSNGMVENEYSRKAAMDQLTHDHGEEFAKAVMRGDLLRKGKDFENFMELDPENQVKIRDMIKARWTTAKAVAFLGTEPADTDPIYHLFFKLSSNSAKELTMEINGYLITITRPNKF